MESDGGSLLPAIVGLVLGVIFIVSFSFHFNIPHRDFQRPPPLDETFGKIERQVPEVKLFMEKYGSDIYSTKGFARSDNGTIKFIYTAAAYVDRDGNGIGEVNRRLDLTIYYDESGGKPIYDSFDLARVKQLEARCREQTARSLDVDKAFTDIIEPAYNGQIAGFIESVKCLS